MENFYFNSSTIFKYLRKVLNEINKVYVDSGIRSAFLMKRYCEFYKIEPKKGAKLALLTLLKDIGVFYQDESIPKNNLAYRAASSYTFLKNCSPLKEDSKPLLYYKAKYIESTENEDYYYGLLITLVNQVIMYDYQEYCYSEIEELLKHDTTNTLHPQQIRRMIKLLKNQPDILEKLNTKGSSLYAYEVSSYIVKAGFSDEELLGFIDTTNFSFEFHNHETLAHTITTASIARDLAKLSRLTDGQTYEIYLAALLHDIGKIRIPKAILCYPGRLNDEDFKLMRKHVEYSKEILEGCFSYKIVEMASNHHEKLDGSGYPRGLRAIDLSIGDKILAVSDVASALYCKRSYKESYDSDSIIEILSENAELEKLDKRIVNHFIDNYEFIMENAKEKENMVLAAYSDMKSEYQDLIESEALKELFNNPNAKNDIFDE